MFTIEARTIIDAPSNIVWQVLVELGKYSEWSTILIPINTARPRLGQPLKLKLSMPDVPSYTVEPEIVTLDTHRHLAWRKQTVLPGLFDGEHHFVLKIMEDENQTELRNYEKYSGLIAAFMKGQPRIQATSAGFETMNSEIKSRSETLYQALPA